MEARKQMQYSWLFVCVLKLKFILRFSLDVDNLKDKSGVTMTTLEDKMKTVIWTLAHIHLLRGIFVNVAIRYTHSHTDCSWHFYSSWQQSTIETIKWPKLPKFSPPSRPVPSLLNSWHNTNWAEWQWAISIKMLLITTRINY